MKTLIPTIIVIGALVFQGCANQLTPLETPDTAPDSEPAVTVEANSIPLPETDTEPEEPATEEEEPEPETDTEPAEPEAEEPEPEEEEEPEPEEPGLPEVGHLAPNFTIKNPDGSTFSLRDFDKPVMLNFWNTGCKYCVVEMPLLADIYEENREEGLVLITINIAESLETVQEFLVDNEIKIPVLLDMSASIARQYLVQYLPTTFFLDAEAIIQDKAVGAFRNEADIEKHLKKIMP